MPDPDIEALAKLLEQGDAEYEHEAAAALRSLRSRISLLEAALREVRRSCGGVGPSSCEICVGSCGVEEIVAALNTEEPK